MREISLISLVLLLTLNTIAQETIILTEFFSNSDQIKSHASVLKGDTTIKHGKVIFYKKVDESDYQYFKGQNHDRLIVAKGQFDNNEKVGLWEFLLKPKFYYDFDKNRIISYQLQHNYPLLASELGIQGYVIIKYDIDKAGQFKNIVGLEGDSILLRGTINNFKKFSVGQAENLKVIAEIIDDWRKKSIIDTIKYRLE